MVVTVIGLGFVGLTTSLGFAEWGHTVYGIEANKERLKKIQAGKLPFMEPGMDEALTRHLGNGRFIPTDDWKTAIKESCCVYYCVGTPYGTDGAADLSQLEAAIKQTVEAIKESAPSKYRVLVVKSTVPPSTTSGRVVPFLEGLGVKVGEDVGAANNPEFLREGHCWDDFVNSDRIVLGVSDEKSADMLRALYKNAPCPVHCVSLGTGEFIKYLSNTSLALLISYANEMSMAADAMGDIDIQAAFKILHEDKRWQSGSIRAYFYPGCGYGGYCLPKDTNAFLARERAAGFEAGILKAVIETNDKMPRIAVERIRSVASTEAKIGILGLSFNAGSDDVREAPSAKIIASLQEAGYKSILAYDPVAVDSFKRLYGDMGIEYMQSMEDLLEAADTAVIVTAWKEFIGVKTAAKKARKTVVDLRYMG